MKTVRMAIALAALLSAVWMAGAAIAEGLDDSAILQPYTYHEIGYGQDLPPAPDAEPSPSDVVIPHVAPEPVVETPSCYAGGCDECCNPCSQPCCDQCCSTCGGCNACNGLFGPLCCCEEEPCRLFPCGVLGQGMMDTYGWLEGGIMWNADDPGNGSNLPVTFQDRDGEFLVNQLYVIAEEPIDNDGCGWDIGGRVDLLYGTDARFTKAAGWELHQDGSDRWNADGQQYQLSMPQLYAEFAYNDLSLKVGHFYTTIGYEVVTAPDNFFYTHAYTMQYGEPFTHTGALLTWKANDQLSLHGGLVNGWDAVDRVDDRLSFLAGGTYSPCCRDWTATFVMITGTEPNYFGDVTPRTMYSFVFDWNINDRLEYVFQHDCGWQSDYGFGEDVEWYGINQYLYYKINCEWKAGLRYEWFNDDDGTRVVDGFNPAQRAGHWHELSLGLNWTPDPNLIVRGECRWDWVDPHLDLTGGPFDLGNGSLGRKDQFLVGFDMILVY